MIDFKTLLHERATSVAFKPPDVAAITRAGRRRIRARRAVTALATVAAVALTGGVVAIVATGGFNGTDRPERLATSPWPSDQVTWAIGSTIHVGATLTIPVGHEIHSYVRTETGFVVLDESDAVYAVNQAGVTPIGHVNDTEPNNRDQQRLVVNSSGTLVGWVDESASPGRLTARIYDAVYGTTQDITSVAVGDEGDLLFFAIDDRTAYWRTGRVEGVHAYDLDTGTDTVIIGRTDVTPGDAIYSFEVYSAENGVLAFSPNDDGTFYAGPSIEDAIELYDRSQYQTSTGTQTGGPQPMNGHVDPVRLSPTGAWLSFSIVEAMLTTVGDPADENFSVSDVEYMPMVFDTTTGDQITLDLAGPGFAITSVWLDDSTLQVLVTEVDPAQPAFRTATAVRLYECSLPAGACEVAAALDSPFPDYVVLPDGRYYAA